MHPKNIFKLRPLALVLGSLLAVSGPCHLMNSWHQRTIDQRLVDDGVEVTAADMPEANRFVLHIMAAVAEQEGRAISERTKAALAAAKARGVKLGWSIPERDSEQRQAARKGAAVNKARALAHAENVLPVIEQIRAGDASLRQIAAELNARGIKTARGGKWHATTVQNIITKESAGVTQAE